MPGQVVGELELERVPQRGQVGGLLDSSESGQPGQHTLHLLGSTYLVLGQPRLLVEITDEGVERAGRPVRDLRPCRAPDARIDPIAESGDEGTQLVGRRGVALAPSDQAGGASLLSDWRAVASSCSA